MDRGVPYNCRRTVLLALLICAGLVGNMASVPLFAGFKYLFGSIAVFMVVSLYGIRWGVLAGLVASAWTIRLFGHPYAMVWLTCEPLFVGLLLRRGRSRNLVLYAALYWPLLGAPLAWLFFLVVMKAPLIGTVAGILMYWTIGITNALIASLLLNYVPSIAALWRSPEERHSIPIHQLLFNLLMSLVLIPAVIVMVLHGRLVEEKYLNELGNDLRISSDVALYELRLKLRSNMLVLSQLVNEADHLPLNDSNADFSRLQLATQLLHAANPNFAVLYTGNAAGHSVTFSPVHGPDDPLIGMDFSDRVYYHQLRDTGKGVVTGIFRPRTDDPAPIVAMGLPVFKEKRFSGYVVAGLNLQPLSETINSARHKPYHDITLIDSDQRVIAGTRPDLGLMAPFTPQVRGTSHRTKWSNVTQFLPGTSESPIPVWQQSGRSIYLGRVALGADAPWSLLVESPWAPYQHKIFREHIRALSILLMVNLLALTASLYVSRRLAAPLLHLSQLTTDLPARLSRETVSAWPQSMVAEIDRLSLNFREMAAALSQRFQEIIHANETLEQRVEERTRSLSNANRELHNEIAERKRTEQQRDRLLRELQQKNKELEGIIYVASHDLRSPLVNVQGFSRRLLKSCTELDLLTAAAELPEDARQGLDRQLREDIPKSLGFITGSVEKMDGLLNGLLRLSRLGRAAICFETLDMRIILEKIVSSMAYQIEAAGARVEIGTYQPCMADGVQVTQIFSNLLDNALKYRAHDRPLVVTISGVPVPDGVRYCVEDNGLGIPFADQEKIWNIFQRLHPEQGPGEGLGLTIARRMADRLGGSIWVESEHEVGSRFYVVLPRSPEAVDVLDLSERQEAAWITDWTRNSSS
ncbi:ATP-binding protein [Geobacter sp. SVR]|uniref:ATP-binding protein n=1 Tax=Geobacter sp. SVR TaxID=2495594 RepID=UPI00143EFA47|nr:ATP-binding protein [Geobacter sp. SVR]BCS55872.1 hypothetical protein GSVR_41800 [Geobacter sp. SVR]GCF83876.1 hypothetical protein GSbR_04760 [Geobacter sp. SVR]